MVSHVYPSSDRLPENLLRFYIHFSTPMSRGEAYRHISFAQRGGAGASRRRFWSFTRRLWDPGMRRFTLLCDPGRVKRGLKPREELGPVLEAGKDYAAFVIDREWPDAQGRMLAGPSRRPSTCFRRTTFLSLDPAEWQIESPRPASRSALAVTWGAARPFARRAIVVGRERCWQETRRRN